MSTDTNIILDKETIERKMRRMALEIAEKNTEEKELIVAGVAGNGVAVAKKLVSILREMAGVTAKLVTIKLNKKDPKVVSIDPVTDFNGRSVIVVDDVSDSGRTMLYALKPFLEGYPKSLQTLVLVERSHKIFPVQTDFTGLSISTTLQEHIYVEVEGDELVRACLA